MKREGWFGKRKLYPSIEYNFPLKITQRVISATVGSEENANAVFWRSAGCSYFIVKVALPPNAITGAHISFKHSPELKTGIQSIPESPIMLA